MGCRISHQLGNDVITVEYNIEDEDRMTYTVFIYKANQVHIGEEDPGT